MGPQRKYYTKTVFERKIFGPTKESNGIWRLKTNNELDELNTGT